LPAYVAWRKEQLPQIPYPKIGAAPVAPYAGPSHAAQGKKEYFCFTGFRSAEIQSKLEAKGHEMTASLSKKTTVLVVADAEAAAGNTEKIKKARELGTRILTRDQLIQEYL
jgi:NAD-dependent DNA ligase